MQLAPLNYDDLPIPQEESWKYTNLPRALPEGLKAEKPDTVTIEGVSKPEQDIVWTGKSGALHHPVLEIRVQSGQTFTLIERHTGEGAYWKNMITRITLEAGAHFTHIRLLEDSLEGVNTNTVHLTVGRDAVYTGVNINTGGHLSRHEVYATLVDENAEANVYGLNMLTGQQHADTTLLIKHAAPHCRSNQFYRSVLAERARAVFQGKIHVDQVAQKTDGYQLSNAILLSPKAEMDVKPELEIYADDVKCSHGATTGQIDDNALFYLRSRGISEAQAKQLMLESFVSEVLEKLPHEALRTQLMEGVSEWLSRTL